MRPLRVTTVRTSVIAGVFARVTPILAAPLSSYETLRSAGVLGTVEVRVGEVEYQAVNRLDFLKTCVQYSSTVLLVRQCAYKVVRRCAREAVRTLRLSGLTDRAARVTHQVVFGTQPDRSDSC